jgi:hypothetical protein
MQDPTEKYVSYVSILDKYNYYYYYNTTCMHVFYQIFKILINNS